MKRTELGVTHSKFYLFCQKNQFVDVSWVGEDDCRAALIKRRGTRSLSRTGWNVMQWAYWNPVKDAVRRRDLRRGRRPDRQAPLRARHLRSAHLQRTGSAASPKPQANRSPSSTTSRPIRTVADLVQSCRMFGAATAPAQVIVALGGGSMIDAAKVLAASGGDFETVRRHLVDKAPLDETSIVPIIAVPTTSGTGSEVTSWATVWDAANGSKYSLAHPRLYPETAVLDPALTLAAPARLDARHRPRRPVARAREHLERQRQSGLGKLRGRGGARDHRHAAAAAREPRRSRAARPPGARQPARRPCLLATPRPRSRTTSPTTSRSRAARSTASPARSGCRW